MQLALAQMSKLLGSRVAEGAEANQGLTLGTHLRNDNLVPMLVVNVVLVEMDHSILHKPL